MKTVGLVQHAIAYYIKLGRVNTERGLIASVSRSFWLLERSRRKYFQIVRGGQPAQKPKTNPVQLVRLVGHRETMGWDVQPDTDLRLFLQLQKHHLSGGVGSLRDCEWLE
jgi:hypothetical protein